MSGDVVGAVSLYLVLPGLVAVFGSWRSLERLEWPSAALAVGCEVSLVGLWQLDRIALRTSSWFAVAAAQLSGNAVGRLLPGGGSTATAVTVHMLRRAGRVIRSDERHSFGGSARRPIARPVRQLDAWLVIWIQSRSEAMSMSVLIARHADAIGALRAAPPSGIRQVRDV